MWSECLVTVDCFVVECLVLECLGVIGQVRIISDPNVESTYLNASKHIREAIGCRTLVKNVIETLGAVQLLRNAFFGQF